MHTSAISNSLAADMSDRAFRVYCVLVLRTTGEWTDFPFVAAEINLNPHEIRHALTELFGTGLVQKDRRYETGATGRKTWHTYVRLAPEKAPADAAMEGAA
ncbi:hypothetical protein ACFCZR_24820 [Streptomyces rubiginosohelvolus]|uniref:hypothetical protein n=1 Tax=Streptomyces rubiginosohelvolus TaxID=67362 RepID=UPI0035DC04E6